MQTLRRCLSCVLVLCIFSVSEQQSTIELSHLPDPLFFLSSDPIQLTCRYNPSQYTFRHWIHPSGTLISSTSERFTLRSQQRSTILTIARAVENDQGTYSCVFRNSQGGSVSQSIVGHFRQAVTIAAPPPEYNVTVGNSATLSCDAQHQNRIQWQNSNRNAISSSSDGRVQIQGTNLFFREVRLGDNGTYYCLASNEVSNDEITSHLVVLETPSVTVTPSSTAVNRSAAVTLTCEARGSPRPSIIWTKVTDTLEVDRNYINKIEVNIGLYVIRTELRFRSIRDRDIGTYHCAASNRAGSASGTTTIQLIGTPSGPQMVELSLVNSTSVNVSWLPPENDGNVEIISYTVTWMVANSTNGGGDSHTLHGPNPQTHYLIPDLHWLMTYTVLVHASNRVGRGKDSEEMNITTDATVPAAPEEVTHMDLAPTSVQVTWRLSANDGGAPITSVRVFYRARNQTWEEAGYIDTVSLDSSSLRVSGLRDDTQYQLRVVAENRMGFGPPKDSETFHTPPPGFPASPTHITATNITDTTAIICWVASDLGRPFRSFNIHAFVNSTSQGILKTVPASKVLRHVPNCTEGAQITDLKPDTCYTFTVAIRNDQGLGQPGAELDVYCTLPPQGCVNDDCTTCSGDGCSSGVPGTTSPRATGLSREIIAVLVVCALIGVALLILVVFLLWKISSTLKRQKSYKFSDVPPPVDSLRRESSRSDKTLLEHDRNGQQQFLKQPSISSSQTSSSDQDTPNTAITIVSEKNPFTFTPPVSAHTLECPRSASLGSMGRSFHMYPIPEHAPATHPYIPPNAHQHTHTLPNHWQVHPYPTSDTHPQHSQEVFEMIENPSNQQFEEEKQAELQSQMLNFSHEVEDPEDEIPPPIPPYRGEDTTNYPSPHLPPPYLGESVSQPANSPRLQHSNCEFHIPDSDEEEDMEYIDNDAYEKVTPSPQSLRRAPPRFAIKSTQRGAVFETVDLRH